MKLSLPAVLVISAVLSIKNASACSSAQLIDYDYQASELLGSSYTNYTNELVNLELYSRA